MLITPITNSTKRVIRQASAGVGHETLCSSPRVSRHQRTIRFGFFSLSVTSLTPSSALKRRLVSGVTQLRQARQESNPQHPLLESGALPN
jgi:hypothetical protein